MQRRNSIEPPAYDALDEANPSCSPLPPDYNQAANEQSRRANHFPVATRTLRPPPSYRRHSSSHIIYPPTQDDPSPSPNHTTTDQPPSQRRSPPSSGSSYYEPRSQSSSDTACTASATTSSSPKPSLFARYRAALAEDRKRRATRVQYISGTEAQRRTGNAMRRHEENMRIGRRASFGDEDFSRSPEDNYIESELSEEGRKRRKEIERRRGKDGVLMLFAL